MSMNSDTPEAVYVQHSSEKRQFDDQRSLMKFLRRLRALSVLLVISSFGGLTAQAQAACGVIDGIDPPIDRIDENYDDFGLFRRRFDGHHTAVDVGFNRHGDPVRAAARGLVTYADTEGWDTEKGVVVIEHTLPDGSIFYTVYGHMEQTDELFFPRVGDCIERGELVGAIGDPSRSLPHLHFEVRDFLPNDGGPGYVVGNPLLEGWYHPLDFMQLWEARLNPAFISYASFYLVPTIPPVLLDSGMIAVASGSTIEGVAPPSGVLWRIETDGVITGLTALPGDRVVAHSRTGQVITLQGGRYAALWTVHGPDDPFVTLDETLVFVTGDGGLEAYDPAGNLLWSLSGGGSDRVTHFETNGTQIALGLRDGQGVWWRLVDANGQVRDEIRFDSIPVFAPGPDESWLALVENRLERIAHGERRTVTELDIAVPRTARMTVDALGSASIYLGDTLLALDADGVVRWQIDYSVSPSPFPPLLQTDTGCLLYALDANGTLNVIDTTAGLVLEPVQLYAGGRQNSSPSARLLTVEPDGRVLVGSGFLTLVIFDGWQLGGAVADTCRLG